MTSEPGLPTSVKIDFEIDLLDLHEIDCKRYPFLLESPAQSARLGRFDILFAFPEETLWLDSEYRIHGGGQAGRGFLTAFDRIWTEVNCSESGLNPPGLPFYGGWFVFLGYALAGEIEPKLNLRTESGLPIAVAVRVPVAVIRDRRQSEAWIVAEPGHEPELELVRRDIADIRESGTARSPLLVSRSLQEEAPEQFLAAVRAAQAYISAGDIYQANLSRAWAGRLWPGSRPADVYRRLRRANPAPFAGLAVFEGFAVISSSPERLLRSNGRRVETRPIAGTRPRDRAKHKDQPCRDELLNHPKERAEHIMLIDLERNDLGRICKPGTVEVDEFMAVETYSHVHHIVSNVSGELLDAITPGAVIRAVFPGGSITGCPKVRCMEIISELEGRARGAYTGAMGYINRDGSADLNILIRTMMSQGSKLTFATGSGIVADSDPLQELEETRAKAKGLLLALEDDD